MHSVLLREPSAGCCHRPRLRSQAPAKLEATLYPRQPKCSRQLLAGHRKAEDRGRPPRKRTVSTHQHVQRLKGPMVPKSGSGACQGAHCHKGAGEHWLQEMTEGRRESGGTLKS